MQDKEKEKTTEELEKQLSGLGRLSDYLAENADLLKKRTIAEQLSRRLVEKGLTRADVISAAGLNDIYAHQIFAGKRRPSRDKVLCLAFGMALTADETQTLLKDCGYAVLYAKDRRDSIILYALYNRQNCTMKTRLLGWFPI